MQPDILTDNYSLAVILFELLSISYPYVGDMILDSGPEVEERVYRGDFPYIFNKNITQNNCPSALSESTIFTSRLSELFNIAFTFGKYNRIVRPTAADFSNALWNASNKVMKCSHCGAWFYPKNKLRSGAICPWCDEISTLQPRIYFFDKYQNIKYKNDIYFQNSPLIKEIAIYYIRGIQTNIDMSYISRISKAGKIQAFSISKGSSTGRYYVRLDKQDLRIVIQRNNISHRNLELKYKESTVLYNEDELIFYFYNIQGNANYPLRYAKFICE